MNKCNRIDFKVDENNVEFKIDMKYISNGFVPKGTIYIDENGTYDVKTYAYANVNVLSGQTYEGSYVVIPKVTEQILETKNLLMIDDVTVKEITKSVFDNEKGLTVQIGEI